MGKYLRAARMEYEVNQRATYPPEFTKLVRDRPYIDEWKESIRQEQYCIRLGDGSLFQFRSVAAPGFSFLQCPLSIVSLGDFARTRGASRPADKYQLLPEYEDYVAAAEERQHVAPIRFEVDQARYESGKHPVAHVHIGCENDIRIAVDKILTPVAFLFVVLRFHYPDAWLQVLSSNLRDGIQRTFRKTLDKVEGFPQNDDDCELFFT